MPLSGCMCGLDWERTSLKPYVDMLDKHSLKLMGQVRREKRGAGPSVFSHPSQRKVTCRLYSSLQTCPGEMGIIWGAKTARVSFPLRFGSTTLYLYDLQCIQYFLLWRRSRSYAALPIVVLTSERHPRIPEPPSAYLWVHLCCCKSRRSPGTEVLRYMWRQRSRGILSIPRGALHT